MFDFPKVNKKCNREIPGGKTLDSSPEKSHYNTVYGFCCSLFIVKFELVFAYMDVNDAIQLLSITG